METAHKIYYVNMWQKNAPDKTIINYEQCIINILWNQHNCSINDLKIILIATTYEVNEKIFSAFQIWSSKIKGSVSIHILT